MLGVAWLRDRQAIVHFGDGALFLPHAPSAAAQLRQRLRLEGYAAAELRSPDSTGEFVIDVEVNGCPASFVISTVAGLTIDSTFARSAGIQTGPTLDTYGGPTGTTGDVCGSTAPVSVVIQGRSTVPLQALIYDLYEYSESERPDDPVDQKAGHLGADFMLLNEAVIDFGAGTLFLR